MQYSADMNNGTLLAEPVGVTDGARLAEIEAARRARLRSASVLSGEADDLPGRPASASPFSVLSGREREVVGLIAAGLSTKEMAARLGVSVKTVETHRQHTMDKLDLSSIAELTKYAVRQGLATLDG